MKTKVNITYKLTGIYSSKTWKQTLNFAKKINRDIIIVVGDNGKEVIEKAYTIDTWKTPQQIKTDMLQRF
jgi:Icc-related predicted phosphoesterase